MKLPNGDQAVVPRTKVLRYLLAPEHPEGGSKARFFLSRGYDPGRPEVLIDDLRAVATSGTLVETRRTRHGIKHIVDGSFGAPDGRELRLRTVWIVERPAGAPRLVTAYPT